MRSQQLSSSSTSATSQMARTTISSQQTSGSDEDPSQQQQRRKEQNQEKFRALKQRKSDLEKLLNEKNVILRKLQRQEQQIIAGDLTFDFSSLLSSDNNNNGLRRISATTSFKLPGSNKNYHINKELSGSVGDMEKKIRQEIIGIPATGYKSDMTLPKTIRNNLRIDYDQRSLLPLGKQTQSSCQSIVQQQQQQQMPLLAKSPTLSLSDLQQHATETNAVVSQHSLGINAAANSPGGQRFGSTNNVNTYYITERRNSMKSLQQLHQQQRRSPKHQRYDDCTMMIMNGASTMPAKSHRIDYDPAPAATRLLIQTPQPGRNSSYLYDLNDSPTIVGNSSNSYSGRASMPPPSNSPQSLNLANLYSPLTGSTLPLHHYQHTYDDTLFSAQSRSCSSATRKNSIHVDTIDSISIGSSVFGDYPSHASQIGLGGYWGIVGNQRIWYTVDTNYDGIEQRPPGGSSKLKKANTIATTPIKSISLGNFDEIVESGSCSSNRTKDEFSDKISISSINSEGNKKFREKQWLETSLDGPLVKAKPTTLSNDTVCPSNFENISVRSSSVSSPITLVSTSSIQHAAIKQQYRNSPTVYAPGCSSGNISDRNKLSSQSIPRRSAGQSSLTAHDPYDHQSNISLSPLTSSAPPPTTNPRSPIIAQLSHHDSIRIESPKNVTVVQQAVFMPYKEVTKPFEMSDFYKYSTKFRQKEKQQQVQVE